MEALAEEINWRHGCGSWKPIIVNEHYEPERVYAIYRMANACVVSSLHDGMNLVAKEFVAAATDLRRRPGALEIHRGRQGVNRCLDDQSLRHGRVCRGLAQSPVHVWRGTRAPHVADAAQVAENNIYRWAGTLLSEAAKLGDLINGCNVAGPDQSIVSAYSRGSRLALLFDYDGTLTPIVEHPALARLEPPACACSNAWLCYLALAWESLPAACWTISGR